jgi:hypothetical protein
MYGHWVQHSGMPGQLFSWVSSWQTWVWVAWACTLATDEMKGTVRHSINTNAVMIMNLYAFDFIVRNLPCVSLDGFIVFIVTRATVWLLPLII